MKNNKLKKLIEIVLVGGSQQINFKIDFNCKDHRGTKAQMTIYCTIYDSIVMTTEIASLPQSNSK